MKLILAPLHGITGFVYRNVFWRHFPGFSQAVAPFITTVQAENVARSHITDVLPENNAEIDLIPQIIGNDPGAILQLALTFEELGYREVNLNLGCPFPKVTAKKRGCGLLPCPDRIINILDFVIPKLTCRLSLKTRLGLKSPDELLNLLPRLEQYPLGTLTIHARTGIQMYTGNTDISSFMQCLTQTSHRVIYNGDIDSKKRHEDLQTRFGARVGHWMIGRSAIANPFLAAHITGKSSPTHRADCTRILREFHDNLYQEYSRHLHGTAQILGKMKEIWRLMGPVFHDSRRFTGKICRAQSRRKYEELVGSFFASDAEFNDEYQNTCPVRTRQENSCIRET